MRILILSLLLFSSLVFADNRAIQTARNNNVRGNILNAGTIKDRGGKKLFALSEYGAYLFEKRGSRFYDKFSKKFKSNERAINESGFVDINRDGYYEFYFAYRSKNIIKLYVYNTNGKGVSYIVSKIDGKIKKSFTLVSEPTIYSWMKGKVRDINSISKPINEHRLDPNSFNLLCILDKNNSDCKISSSKINNKLIFQEVYGNMNINVKRKLPNGVYLKIYNGTPRSLDIKKSTLGVSTIVISSKGNGKLKIYTPSTNEHHHEKHIVLPDKESAKSILKTRYKLDYDEVIYEIFIFKENSKPVIVAITNKGVYKLIDYRGDWRGFVKFLISNDRKILNKHIVLADMNNDNRKDVFFVSVDRNNKMKASIVLFFDKSNYQNYGAVATKRNNIIYKFYNNPPYNIKEWFKNLMNRKNIINQDNYNMKRGDNISNSIRIWISDNNYLHEKEYKNLRLTYYPGNNDITFARYFNNNSPVIARLRDSSVIYQAHYRGLLTAYDSDKNYSYIIWLPKNNTTFITSMYNYGNFIVMTLSKNGIIVFDKKRFTLKHIMLRALENNNAWSITLKGNNFYILTNKGEIKVKKSKILNQRRPKPLNYRR